MAVKPETVQSGVEYPRGEIEILAPGEGESTRPGAMPFESAFGGGTYTFQTRTFQTRTFKAGSGGVLGAVAVVAGVAALFVLAASAFVLIASVAVIGVAGFYLRGRLRKWLGR